MRSPLVLSLALLSASVSVSVSTSASARERARIPGTDLALEVDGTNLVVRRQALRARIPVDLPYPDLLLQVAVKSTATVATARVEANCNGSQTVTLPRARLEALIANAAAMKLARDGQGDAAAVGFAQAWKVDPTLVEAGTNLAAAQARAGRDVDAVGTLVTAAASDPIWVAWRLAGDPDLGRVAESPRLAAMYRPAPVAATLRALGKKHVATSPARGLYAWTRNLQESMSEEGHDDELWIAEAATGAVSARLTYTPGRRGEAAVDRTLAALGFTVDGVVPRRLQADDGGATLKGTLPPTGLTVAVKDGRVRLRRDGRSVGEGRFRPIASSEGSAWADREVWAAQIPGAVLVGTVTAIGDGCGAWSFDDVLWVRVIAGRAGSGRRGTTPGPND